MQATLPPPLPPTQSSNRTRTPNWLNVLPFISLHLMCLAILWVNVTMVGLVLCGVLYFARMVAITVGYHRYFCHRAYKTSRLLQGMLACLGCTAMQKGPLWWTAHHRMHHRHADTTHDPHSPRSRSWWWAHVGWILSPNHDRTNWQAVRDWSRYPELRWLNRYHWVPGLLLGGLCWIIGSWSGLVWGFCVSTVLLYHATFAVNSLCHLFGQRRYATADDSRNNLLVALLTLGEGWHNNHHHRQNSARQGFYWWEIDISYYLIKLLGFAGLVWNIREPVLSPREQGNRPCKAEGLLPRAANGESRRAGLSPQPD